jgi:GTP-binding protein HflX
VGYTNVGKSTLLRALTKADVLVEDKLFATLDTTARKFELPDKHEILLIDTVGFIRKLPHTLVAAFRSTLEEVIYTDILLHLVDISSPTVEAQTEAAYSVLKELHADTRPMITVLNKFDACTNPLMVHKMRVKYPKTVVISAKTGEGFSELMEMMLTELRSLRKRVKLRVPQSHYALVSQLMREGKVYFSEYDGNDIMLEVEIPHRLEHKVHPFLF